MRHRMVYSFQAKVLSMIAVAMLALMAVTIWVVNSHVIEQLEQTAAKNLRTSDAVFRNMQRDHAENLLLRFGNVPNEPRFKAVSQLREVNTMRFLLKELVTEYEVDSIVFTTTETAPFASVARRPETDLRDFEIAAQKIAERARAGLTVYGTDQIGRNIYELIGVPVVISGQSIGVLVFAVECGQSRAREFHQLTGCDVVLMANDVVTATTLSDPELKPTTVREFANTLATAGSPERGSIEDINQLIIGRDHRLFVAGRFKSATRNRVLWYLLVSSYESELTALRTTQRSLLLIGFCGVTIAMLLAWLLVRRVTQPLRQLRDISVAVGRGDFSRQADVQSSDECGQLAAAFNAMTLNLASARQELEQTVETLRTTRDRLTQSEKLSAIGEFVAGVTHELNNPLTSVIGFAELMQQSTTDERHRRQIDIVAREAHRCRKIVQSLLSFSRQHKIERKLINVNDVVDAALDILQYQLRTGNIQVERRLSPNLPPVLADDHQLQQVIINLLNNARQVLEDRSANGRIRIVSQAQAGQVEVSIQDNGPGISSENLSKIFAPFFTTKEVGKGTGLGLSLCYGILQEHGGTITAHSGPGAGATFVMTLPAADPVVSDNRATVPDRSPNLNGTGKRILIIDDEDGILALTRDLLLEEQFTVETASDGAAGLRKARATPFDVILCDWKMPGLTGGQVYEQLRRTHPELAARMVFMTGDVVSDTTRQFLDNNERACIAKPFSIDEFHNIIAGMLFAHQS
ncbi:MAG: ATP-binding protein [Verrucomicrobiota bacterium]